MKKIWKRTVIYLWLGALCWCGTVIADKYQLSREILRLHIVAASDSPSDQAVKLQIRDAVTGFLEPIMEDITDHEEAKECLGQLLPRLESLANGVLEENGCGERARVTLAKEAFDTRVYDTFTLPAGVYDALRITVGEGEGRNWWCVVFPSLCVPATAEGFEKISAEAGMPESLTCALTGEEGYEIRFFFLDVLGRLENMLYNG